MSITPTKVYSHGDHNKTPKKSGTNPRRSRMPSLKAMESLASNSGDNSEEDSEKQPVTERLERRKSARKPSPTKKYNNSEYELSGAKRKRSLSRQRMETESDETEEDIEELQISSGTSKVHDLQLLEEFDVAGRSMFGFNTPKKRDGMALAAMNTPKTPKTLAMHAQKTPDSKRKKASTEPKTPSHVRRRVKNQIAKLVNDSDCEMDFSGDDSSFDPLNSGNESSSQSSEGTTSEDNEDANDEPITPSKGRRPIIVPVLPKTPTAARQRQTARSKKITADFVPESDGYFQSHSSAKIHTSDHTLDRLKNPRLPADRIFSLLATMRLTDEHEQAISAMLEEYKTYFPKWMYILNEGFNILLYGLGSKRNLLQNFHREVLSQQTVLVINGFFPSLTIKDILDSIMSDILDITASTANPHEAVDIIEEEFSLISETHLYLIVHNIDGTMLRNGKAQSILARLAKIPNIHLLASIDHINTPLLWDHTKLSNFNFSWWDCTTMLSYTDETAFENSLLVQNSGELALSSLRSVFSSLTTNSRGIYMLIVKYQLQNKGNPSFQGMLFKDLYWSCRESFLVSSDLALRAQLTEFLDHKLVKSKRNLDGSEQLTIPIDSNLLQQFLEEQQQQCK